MFTPRLFLSASVLIASAAPAVFAQGKTDSLLVFLGSYTKAGADGIHVYRLNMADGSLKAVGTAGGIANPSFLSIHPSGKFLYAVGEVSNFEGKKAGGVAAFALDPATGKLTPLNQQASGGAGPCHITVDKAGKTALVANYGGGSVASLPIGADGKLSAAATVVQHVGSSVNKGRQTSPHAHSINVDAASKFAFAADLGLDKVLIYKLDSDKGTMTANDPPSAAVAPGSGPRHFAFHPSGKYAYVINEMSQTVTAFSYDAVKGALAELHTLSTVSEPVKGNSTAEIVCHPSGKWVYGSNRGHDSIAVFAVDEATGRLKVVGHEPTGGRTPRNFNVDPTGTYLLAANQGTGSVVVFRIDQTTGMPKPTGHKIDVPAPVCVKFLASPVSK